MVNETQPLQFMINDDYCKIFKPFYYVHATFGMQRCSIKNGLVFPCTKWNILHGSLTGLILLTCLVLTLEFSDFPNPLTKAVYYTQYFIHTMIFFCLLFVRFYYKDDHYTLLRMLQSLGKIKTLSSRRTTCLAVALWLFLGYTISYYLFFIWVRSTTDVYWTWPRVVMITAAVLTEMEIIHIAYTMIYMTFILKNWKKALIRYQVTESEETSVILTQFMKTFELTLQAYGIKKKMCQIIVLICFVMSFVEFLTMESFFFIWAEYKQDKYAQFSQMALLVIGWMTKMLLIQTLLCVSCELFYIEIENIREVVIRKTNKEKPQFHVVQSFTELKSFSKSVCRTIDSQFSKLTACFMFTVDAGLMLRFLAIIATYTVVLLQFAF